MNEPVTTDTLLKIIGLKEVEISMLKQQVEALAIENAKFDKSVSKKESKP